MNINNQWTFNTMGHPMGYVAAFICLVALITPSAYVAAKAELNVIAIDYPPFTTENIEGDNGIAFRLLQQALSDSELTVNPDIYSTARAHKLIRTGQWCASFYPPKEATEQLVNIPLAVQPIKLGLYRKRQESPFRWDDLSELGGSQVAYLRAVARDGIGLDMTNAGLVIFNVESVRQGLQLLAKGRVDYAFADNVSGAIILNELGLDINDYQFSQNLFRALPMGIWLNLSCEQALKAHQVLTQRRQGIQ
ncbi:hypothetical protein [Shewanella colwelliana]|uniref:hypothetical protein n=1 Tax=Shewanella colwelliana TaxID=23 RepID=UPI0022AEF31C|nr:hypothetical protein [Shewanella colwelliana]MCZ4336372.1 hypothetical protein [Shewanella colwelliana]